MAIIAYQIIGWCWLLFLIYWIINASRVKAVAEAQGWEASLKYKLPTILGAVLLWRPVNLGPLQMVITPRDDMTAIAGAILCIAGLGIAIWARRTLAGNWSSNVTFKQGHELIKTGPYRFARHPIYTGLLLMAFGTALANGRISSWLGLLLFFNGFWIKLKMEEAVMLQHFPDQYPAYRKEVKAIVPFVL
jgi:protein-S-isoprenylcysteine O-methyltransferase Ste14